jgi:hypothetical protein
LCALGELRDPCVIYSLGSYLEFDFEYEMLRRTQCEIHTFDCTVNMSLLPQLPPRIHFHNICLGEESASNPRFRSLASLAAEFGHKEIALLKMDIEGFEFDVVESMYLGAVAQGGLSMVLPAQISFEMHFIARQANRDHQLTYATGEMALLWMLLSDLGCAVISRENNPICPHCVEFTMVCAIC